MMRIAMMMALLCVFLAGCEKSTSEQVQDKMGDAKHKVKEAGKNVWSGTVSTIDKAKGVGKTIMDAAEDQRRRIDKEGD